MARRVRIETPRRVVTQCRAVIPIKQGTRYVWPTPAPTALLKRCQFDALGNHSYCEFHIWIEAKHKAKP